MQAFFDQEPLGALSGTCAPALPPAENSERVVDSRQNLQEAPGAIAPTRPKQREGRRFQFEDAPCASCHAAKSAKRSSMTHRISRTLHAPALPPAEISEKGGDSKQESQDAPRANAPRASAPTR